MTTILFQIREIAFCILRLAMPAPGDFPYQSILGKDWGNLFYHISQVIEHTPWWAFWLLFLLVVIYVNNCMRRV